MAYAVLAMVALVAGILLTSVIVMAGRTRRRQRHFPHGSDGGGDVSWLPAVMSGDSGSDSGSDGCAGADAGGCDGGGGGGD